MVAIGEPITFPHPVPACLWRENPYRLASLWDLVRHFDAFRFYEQLDFLSKWERIAQTHIEAGNGDLELPNQLVEANIKGFIRTCMALCEQLELNESWKRLRGPFVMQMFAYGKPTWRTLNTEFRVLGETIESELRERCFAFVPMGKVKALDGLPASNPWPLVSSKLPATATDIVEAVYCYALERNTACVFHLMRVAEHCLRALAKKLKVRLTYKGTLHQIEYADWDKVISGCKTELAKIAALPRSSRRQEKLELYSDAADHCLFMKDVFRNNVSHSRRSYLDSEAKAAMDRVQDFAQFIATRIIG